MQTQRGFTTKQYTLHAYLTSTLLPAGKFLRVCIGSIRKSAERAVSRCAEQVSLRHSTDRKSSETRESEKKGQKANKFQINGKDSKAKGYLKGSCVKDGSGGKVVSGTVEPKVNKINNVIPANIKSLPGKESVVKPFINGDIVMEEFGEQNTAETNSYSLSSSDAKGNHQDGLYTLPSTKESASAQVIKPSAPLWLLHSSSFFPQNVP